MRLVITNLRTVPVTIIGLSDNGTIQAGATRTFEVGPGHLGHSNHTRTGEPILGRLLRMERAGEIEFRLRPSVGLEDQGNRIYDEWFRVLHSDLDDADTQETVDGSYTFPNGAWAIGGYANLNEVFAGGGNSAVLIDLGHSGDETAFIANINGFTGQDLGRKVMAAAIPPTYIGGRTIRMRVDTTDGTCAGLTTGSITGHVFWMAMKPVEI